MSDILINQSVAILCDGNNIERSIHEMSKNPKAMINFDQLIPKLLDGRGLNRLIYFREGKSISGKSGLAGGLNVNNITEALRMTKAKKVDLSSGVEDSKGRKSINKITTFLKKIKKYEVNLTVG